jgi:hypothetical protein
MKKILAIFLLSVTGLHASDINDLTWRTVNNQVTITRCENASQGKAGQAHGVSTTQFRTQISRSVFCWLLVLITSWFSPFRRDTGSMAALKPSA